jgi:D-alanyl-D-alanine carboxypeptidase
MLCSARTSAASREPRGFRSNASILVGLLALGVAMLPIRVGASEGQVASRSLSARIREVLADSSLDKATVAVHVETLQEGRILFSKNADVPLTPGSNMKLLTTAAALHELGPDYRFRTRFRAEGPLRDGVLDGDLVVVGGGDPLFSGRLHGGRTTAPFEAIADRLAARGLRRVRGDLVLDPTFFDRELHHSEWPVDQLHKDYCAPISGLALNGNCVDFQVHPGARSGQPGSVDVNPASRFVRVTSEVRTVRTGSRARIAIPWGNEPGRFLVRGTIPAGSPPYPTSVPVREPVLYFGALLEEVLENRGIRIEGELRVLEAGEASAAWARGIAPEGGDVPGGEDSTEEDPGDDLVVHESSLVDAVTLTNETSHNFSAEQIVKTLGREVVGVGSFEAGTSVVRDFVRGLELWEDGCRIADGSGLSRQNRFTARGFVGILRHVLLREPPSISEPFFLSLPVSGMRGSLEDRIDEDGYRGQVAAKTGYVHRASALSGFARSRTTGETLVFSIVMNGFEVPNPAMKRLQDRIARILVDYEG